MNIAATESVWKIDCEPDVGWLERSQYAKQLPANVQSQERSYAPLQAPCKQLAFLAISVADVEACFTPL
jgi:hypothetical protein